MRIEKIFGWALLILGIFIILWTLNFAFKAFKGEKQFFKVFEPKKISKIEKTPQTLEEKLQKEISESLKEALPIEEIYKILNLVAFSIFSGIFIFGGSQIASLGIKLLKK